ncbi:hypothetical protein H8S90_07655 [Olivibacter sp. SDN3]|uniref:hypothetical protein n=1 Tax=Olivibacter sp. SDN3 TaxID=2764720 RepID=UPI0016510DB9|nr:hypothetical protein [Olivibacter sp. SDN3]QNL51441.1 hypothetical protein H8S90_07655 [Olivibacter sp. SDN3]
MITFENEVKADQLYITINNEDNRPLQLTKVGAWQRKKELVTYLEAGKSYQLFLGKQDAAAPYYDLSSVEERIKENIPAITLKPFQQTDQPDQSERAHLFKSVYWFWIALILVIVLLLLMSNGLLKVMKRKK